MVVVHCHGARDGEADTQALGLAQFIHHLLIGFRPGRSATLVQHRRAPAHLPEVVQEQPGSAARLYAPQQTPPTKRHHSTTPSYIAMRSWWLVSADVYVAGGHGFSRSERSDGRDVSGYVDTWLLPGKGS